MNSYKGDLQDFYTKNDELTKSKNIQKLQI